MLPEVEKLVLVQNRDQRILAINKELAGIPLTEEDCKEKLVEDEQATAAAKLALQEVEVAINSLEIDVQTRKDSINKLKTQQFETKKNEEFWAMGEDIKRYEGEIDELEEKEINLMETAEELGGTYRKATASLEEMQESVAGDLESLAKLQKNLESERTSETEKRGKSAEPVDEDLLELYDRLIKAKNGVAVVGLIDGACNGCHMKVIQATVVDVKSEKAVAHCENCGRILYWWTDED